MVIKSKSIAFGALCGLLLVAAPYGAAALPTGVDAGVAGVSAAPFAQSVAATTPSASRCVKWTRRWNHRHGFGHRRCVQWR